jgi:hypothetical protein
VYATLKLICAEGSVIAASDGGASGSTWFSAMVWGLWSIQRRYQTAYFSGPHDEGEYSESCAGLFHLFRALMIAGKMTLNTSFQIP